MCHGQILNDALRTARKPHRCDECGRRIDVGREHRYHAVVDEDRELRTHRDCSRCAAAVELLMDDEYGDTCYSFGDAHENARGLAREAGWRAFRTTLRTKFATLRARLRPQTPTPEAKP